MQKRPSSGCLPVTLTTSSSQGKRRQEAESCCIRPGLLQPAELSRDAAWPPQPLCVMRRLWSASQLECLLPEEAHSSLQISLPNDPGLPGHAASHPGRAKEGAGMDTGVGMRAASHTLSISCCDGALSHPPTSYVQTTGWEDMEGITASSHLGVDFDLPWKSVETPPYPDFSQGGKEWPDKALAHSKTCGTKSLWAYLVFSINTLGLFPPEFRTVLNATPCLMAFRDSPLQAVSKHRVQPN